MHLTWLQDVVEKWGEKWGATIASSIVSDVFGRYSLGTNPRGVKDYTLVTIL